MKHTLALFGCVLMGAAFVNSPAIAAVSAQQAAQLGTTLTWSGANPAGNADGSIPPYTGGLVEPVPAGFDHNTSPHGDFDGPDPYAGEKPLFSITNANLAQYVQFVTPGMQAVFKKYPDFRMDIYPTHRDFAAPQSVIDNTKLNATRSTTVDGGYQVSGAWGGIPFPIPQNGFEAVWNEEWTWQGYALDEYFNEEYTTPEGAHVHSTYLDEKKNYPYYSKPDLASADGFWWQAVAFTLGPEYQAGGLTAALDHYAYVDHPRQGYEYLVGERRLRKAPQVAYDNPNSLNSSVCDWDDTYMFNGALDRFTYKLVGKAEMYIPYNELGWYKLHQGDDRLKGQELNPDGFRWEKHRVWIVDFDLAPGERHVIPHRRIYIDEDSWIAVEDELYDAQGTMVKAGHMTPIELPWIPVILRGDTHYYNLESGQSSDDEMPLRAISQPPQPMSDFTPEALEADGVR